MRGLWRWIKRALIAVVLLVLLLLTPIGYTELACRPTGQVSDYVPILSPEYRRDEARTLLTYPEWHIVHAYEEYSEVIRTGDPDDFAYLRSIMGFWSSLCTLSETAGAHGGFSGEMKTMIYTIGASFSAELLAKAAYEETIGRVFTWMRGPNPAPLDEVSARQARSYAQFLRQVPWYRWDFAADRAALNDAATGALRDRERRIALGLEYGLKSQYAKVIGAAVANMKPDALRLRMIVQGDAAKLATLPEVTVIGETKHGIELETPRYRKLTALMAQMAEQGTNFVEIAGNDQILFTALSDGPTQALHSFRRQGFGDMRHLILVDVADLADRLRQLDEQGLTLEHIHDY